MSRTAWLALIGIAVEGCQLVAPLPESTSTGAGASGGGTPTTAAPSSGSYAGECGDPACSTYCHELDKVCTAAPQYPSMTSCCAACSALGAASLDCREPPAVAEAVACSKAGAAGATGVAGCVSGCTAVCTLFAAACADVESSAVAECPKKCAETPPPAAFALCLEDAYSCRLEHVLRALDAHGKPREDQCEKAVKHECTPCK
ncbi:MAG: hypothetical protein U0414_16170 [Polyangiaceae bacterium]